MLIVESSTQLVKLFLFCGSLIMERALILQPVEQIMRSQCQMHLCNSPWVSNYASVSHDTLSIKLTASPHEIRKTRFD